MSARPSLPMLAVLASTPSAQISTYSLEHTNCAPHGSRRWRELADHHTSAPKRPRDCNVSLFPSLSCVIVVSTPTLMNGRRNEEFNSDGRRADSDNHVVPDGVRLDIQLHLVELIDRKS